MGGGRAGVASPPPGAGSREEVAAAPPAGGGLVAGFTSQLWDDTIPPRWRRRATAVMLLWLAAAPVFGVFAVQIFDETTLDFAPPSGSESDKATKELQRFAPLLAALDELAIFVHKPEGVLWDDTALRCTNPPSQCDCAVAEYSRQLQQAVMSHPSAAELGVYVYGACIQPLNTSNLIAGELIGGTPRGASTLIVIVLTHDGSSRPGGNLYKLIIDTRDHYLHLPVLGDKYEVGFTGVDVVSIDAREGAVKDALRIDVCFSGPGAILVFFYYIRSIRLMFLPLSTLVLTIGSGFALSLPIVKALATQSVVPEVMISGAVAFNIDYNLFLLMRFKEARRLGFDLAHTVRLVMFETAAHTVLISGSLVVLACFGMALIPCNPVRTLGLCLGINTACAVLINCTLTPSILMCFGRILDKPDFELVLDWALAKWARFRHGEAGSPLVNEAELPQVPVVERRRRAQARSIWFRITNGLRRYSLAIIVVTLAAAWPLYTKSVQLKTNLDPFEYAPVGADSVAVWKRIGGDFPEGKLQPYYLVFSNETAAAAPPHAEFEEGSGAVSIAATGLFTDHAFRRIQGLLSRIQRETVLRVTDAPPLSSFVGPPVLPLTAFNATKDILLQLQRLDCDLLKSHRQSSGWDNPCLHLSDWKECLYQGCTTMKAIGYQGANISWEEASILSGNGPGHGRYNCSSMLAKMEMGPTPPGGTVLQYLEACVKAQEAYAELLRWTISQPSHDAMTVAFFAPEGIDPSGPVATQWMEELRGIFDDFNAEESGVTVRLTGGNAVARDLKKIIDDATPVMLASTIAAVVVLVAGVFRSAIIPVRMAITIAYSVACSFGVCYYAFQTDTFHWLMPHLSKFPNEGLMFVVPNMALTVCIALGLDYDVFLLSRIVEIRCRGFDDTASVLKGVRHTGSIITGAGLIMAFAFGGLIFSSSIVMNQFGLVLFVCVLLDTFIVRTIFVPATMFLMGRWTWWPRRMPEVRYGIDDFVDEVPVERVRVLGEEEIAVARRADPTLPCLTAEQLERCCEEGEVDPGADVDEEDAEDACCGGDVRVVFADGEALRFPAFAVAAVAGDGAAPPPAAAPAADRCSAAGDTITAASLRRSDSTPSLLEHEVDQR